MTTPAEAGGLLQGWLLAAWFVGLLAATPFYTPYQRLTLPWLMSAWLGAAALVGWWARANELPDSTAAGATARRSSALRQGLTALVILAAMGVSGALIVRRFEAGVVGWQDRTGVEEIAARLVDAVAGRADTDRAGDNPGAPRAVVYVYAEPAVFFHLSATAADRIAIGPVTNLDFVHPRPDRPPIPTYLVAGPHADHTAAFAKQWEQLGDRFELVGRYGYTPSDLVFLDHYDPRAFLDPGHRPEETLRLYRVR